MLIDGDLVRVPQGTVIMNMEGDHSGPLPLRVSSDPTMAIVIQNKTSSEDLVKILMGDEVVFVDKRVIKLVEG